jgi:Kef-type K+ transport system membrane component KefB
MQSPASSVMNVFHSVPIEPVDRPVVGICIIPRGEVDIVFAAIVRTLGRIGDTLVSTIIFTSVVTTQLAPPWVKIIIHRQKEKMHHRKRPKCLSAA